MASFTNYIKYCLNFYFLNNQTFLSLKKEKKLLRDGFDFAYQLTTF